MIPPALTMMAMMDRSALGALQLGVALTERGVRAISRVSGDPDARWLLKVIDHSTARPDAARA
jgi:hypothetical protein